MGDVIDRWRLNQGWNPYDEQTQELAIQSWVTSLKSANIPVEMYAEAYENALRIRAKALMNGKDVPKFGVELLIAAWESGLKYEWEQRRINQRKFLPDTAKSQCQRCYGLGKEFVYDEQTGRSLGVKPTCDHRPIEPGEFLYRKLFGDGEEIEF